MTDAELELMIDRAAKKGAREALKDIGLYDGEAYGDMREVRSLLDDWRETKRTVGQTAAKFFTMMVLGLIAAGVYMELGNK